MHRNTTSLSLPPILFCLLHPQAQAQQRVDQVRFDFRETVPFVADYQPIAPKTSSGYEVVMLVRRRRGPRWRRPTEATRDPSLQLRWRCNAEHHFQTFALVAKSGRCGRTTQKR